MPDNLSHVMPTTKDLERSAGILDRIYAKYCSPEMRLTEVDRKKFGQDLRQFHDHATRTAVVKGKNYHCDGTVYRSARVLDSDVDVIGSENRSLWDEHHAQTHGKYPIHIEHTIPVKLMLDFLISDLGNSACSSKENFLDFLFLNSVLCCVARHLGDTDERKNADQNGSSAHPNFDVVNNRLVRFADLTKRSKSIQFDEILPFSRYIDTGIVVRRYKNEESWEEIDIHTYTIADHLKYFQNLYQTDLTFMRNRIQ
jgi:hypothetical protein